MPNILKYPLFLINRLTLNWSRPPKVIVHFLYWLLLSLIVVYFLVRIVYIKIASDFIDENKKNEIGLNVSKEEPSEEFYSLYGIREEFKQFKYFYCKEYDKRHVFMKLSQYQYGYELNSWHIFLIELEISRRINTQMSRAEIIRIYQSYEEIKRKKQKG